MATSTPFETVATKRDEAPEFFCVTDALRRFAAERATHPALICEGRVLTYADLDALADRVAAALQRDGVVPQEAVAICAAASIRYAAVFLGALRAGAALAPLSPSSSPESLAAMLRNSGARLLFADRAAAALLAAAPGAGHGNGPQVVLIDREADRDEGGEGGEGAPDPFEAWLGTASTPEPVSIDPAWPFNIIYSSGTTGTPKGIVQSHAMRFAYAERSLTRGYGPDAVTLISTPLYSNTTLVSFFPTLTYGGTVVLLPKFDAQRYLELAQQYRVTHTMLVPVQYQRLLAYPDFDRYDLSSFRAKFCTSAPFAASIKAEVLRRWPGKLTEYYGMTEGGASCELIADEHPDKLHTVGTLVTGHEMRLIDETGREVPPGEAGEVVGRSPAMMTGYYGQPEKTAEAEWYDEHGVRYIRTGDVGRFDEDGFLVLMDRKKDMIISGGFNLYPSDLERELLAHPAVLDAAVVGMPSARWGETPVAFVTLRAGEAIDDAGLLEWANARLGKMQRLAALVVTDSLPRSAIGKILKRELREQCRVDVP